MYFPQILYAYVEGGDFDVVAEGIAHDLDSLINSRRWASGEAWVVNHRREAIDGSLSWELGINLTLPVQNSETQGWFSDVEDIAICCRNLAEKFQVKFVIGISNQGEIADDLFSIDSGPLDIEALRRLIGDASSKSDHA